MKFLFTLIIFLTLLSVPYWMDRILDDRIQSWYVSYGWGLLFLTLSFVTAVVTLGILMIIEQVWNWIYECF